MAVGGDRADEGDRKRDRGREIKAERLRLPIRRSQINASVAVNLLPSTHRRTPSSPAKLPSVAPMNTPIISQPPSYAENYRV